MNHSLIVQKQNRLAQQALLTSGQKCQKLYRLLHWEKWLEVAAKNMGLLANPMIQGIIKDLRQKIKEHYYLGSNPLNHVSNLKKAPKGKIQLQYLLLTEAIYMILEPIFVPASKRRNRGVKKEMLLLQSQLSSSATSVVIAGAIPFIEFTATERIVLQALKSKIRDRQFLGLIKHLLSILALSKKRPIYYNLSQLLRRILLQYIDLKIERIGQNRTSQDRAGQALKKMRSISYFRIDNAFIYLCQGEATALKETKDKISNILKSISSNPAIKIEVFKLKPNKKVIASKWEICLKLNNNIPAILLSISPIVLIKIKANIKSITQRKDLPLNGEKKAKQLSIYVQREMDKFYPFIHSKEVKVIKTYAAFRFKRWLLNKHKGRQKIKIYWRKYYDYQGNPKWELSYTISKPG